MNNTIFFIDSEYSERQVASRPIKQFALDEINYSEFGETSLGDIVIFVKSNLIGLSNQIINEFIKKKDKQEILIGLLDSEPCLIGINANLLNKILPSGASLYDNIKKEWPRYDLIQNKLKLLNNTAKIIAFNEEVQNKLRKNAIDKGVHLQDPATTYLSYDTEFGNNVLVEPNVYFGQKVKVYDNVHIKAFSYLEGVQIEKGAEIGPFARIRGSCVIGNNAKVGNFVEIKNSTLGTGTKVSHLSYIGDAQVGENVNIGAGVITCNYDGLKKYTTVIHDNTFVGSNSTLIAPITIGMRSLIGAGSFINTDVPDNTFAVGRSKQNMKPNKRK
jgi:serine acetyltransferase